MDQFTKHRYVGTGSNCCGVCGRSQFSEWHALNRRQAEYVRKNPREAAKLTVPQKMEQMHRFRDNGDGYCTHCGRIRVSMRHLPATRANPCVYCKKHCQCTCAAFIIPPGTARRTR